MNAKSTVRFIRCCLDHLLSKYELVGKRVFIVCIGWRSNKKVRVYGTLCDRTQFQHACNDVQSMEIHIFAACVLNQCELSKCFIVRLYEFFFPIGYNSLEHEFRAFDTNSHWNALYDGWFEVVFVI